jgi:hypothetical protein
MVDAVVGGLAAGVAGSLLGGGSTAPSTQPVKVEGAEFQPFSFMGGSGVGVTGTPTGDYGYSYDTTLPSWLTQFGATGGAAADPLLQRYLQKLQGEDAYSAADEFYRRGLAQLQPELEAQRVKLGEGLFGSGRLGLKVAGEGAGYGAGAGAVNPEIAGFGAGTTKALADLYTTSLTKGAQLRADELNQLKEGYAAMLSAGLAPAEIEQGLMKLLANLEGARATAMKAGTTFQPLAETSQSMFAGLAGQAIGSGVKDYVGQGMKTGNWSLFGGGGSSNPAPVYDHSIFANPTATTSFTPSFWSTQPAAFGASPF